MLEWSNLSGQRIEGKPTSAMNAQKRFRVCGPRGHSSVCGSPGRSGVCGPRARAVLGLGIAYFGLTFAAVALAEPTSADKSLATQLFKEGRTLVDQGKY